VQNNSHFFALLQRLDTKIDFLANMLGLTASRVQAFVSVPDLMISE